MDDRTIVGCKDPVYLTFERNTYDVNEKLIGHYKLPQSDSELTPNQSIADGSILAIARHLFCSPRLRAPLLSKSQAESSDNTDLIDLINLPTGDGEAFYGNVKDISDGEYQKEVVFVVRNNSDHSLKSAFPNLKIQGALGAFRTFAELVEINCAKSEILTTKSEYYDSQGNLVSLISDLSPNAVPVVTESPIGVLTYKVCGPSNFGGTYEGMNFATYKTGARQEQKIIVTTKQVGDEMDVAFQAPGGSGEGRGKLSGKKIPAITLNSTIKECAGYYDGSLDFSDGSVSWLFTGQDCGGEMEGHGTATKVIR